MTVSTDDSDDSDDDPFRARAPQEESELSSLARSVGMASGFTLFIARCNDEHQRDRLIAQFTAMLAPKTVARIQLEEPVRHLLDDLRARDLQADVVSVSGLEHSVPQGATEAPVIANLNAARDSFAHALDVPLVLWVPERVLKALVHGAPDFFSIQSGVFFFALRPQQAEEEIEALTRTESFDALSTREREERVERIERLREDFALLPPRERDLKAETGLVHRLSELLFSLFRKESARAIQQEEKRGRGLDDAPMSSAQPMANRRSVVLLHAPEDRQAAREFERHLRQLPSLAYTDLWHSGEIRPGQRFDDEMRRHVATADLLLVLVSPDLLASHHAFGVELEHAMERERAGKAHFIPILLRPTAWEISTLARFQSLPRSGKPILSSRSPDKVWNEVTREIAKVLEAMQGRVGENALPPRSVSPTPK